MQIGKVCIGLHFKLLLEMITFDNMTSVLKSKSFKSQKFISQHQWAFEGVLVPMAWITFTSVNCTIYAEKCNLKQHIVPSKWCNFQRRFWLFQRNHAKPHSACLTAVWLCSKRMWVLLSNWSRMYRARMWKNFTFNTPQSSVANRLKEMRKEVLKHLHLMFREFKQL